MISGTRSQSAPRDRVEAAVRELAAQGVLDGRQAEAVLRSVRDALPGDAVSQRRGRVAELAGYLGGAFAAAAAIIFVAQTWETIERVGQVSLLGFTSLLLLAAGAAVGGGTPRRLRALGGGADDTRRRLVSTLATLAAGAAAGASASAVDEHQLLAAALAGLAVALPGYLLVPSMLGQLGSWLAGLGALLGVLDVLDVFDPLPAGLCVLGLGAVWVVLATRDVFAEPRLGLGVGAATALLGAQLPLGGNRFSAYLLTLLVAAGCFTGYLRVRSWVLPAVGVLAVAVVAPEAVLDWTGGSSLGGAAALLAASLALLVSCAVGLRLRKADRRPPTAVEGRPGEPSS
ncbi:MAG: hypothetical protein ACRDPK_17680 [Carbonactinosporaceae bacterium]